MKILWVSARQLLPLDTGAKIRSYHTIRHLAARHELTLLSYYGGQRDLAYDHEITRHLPGTVVLHTGAGATASSRVFDYARSVFLPAPYSVVKFTATEVRRTLADWLNQRRFDVAVCDFLCASLNFPQVAATPVVLFQHNIEAALWRRQARWERNWVKKLAFKLEAAKLARYEPIALRRFDHVVAVSECDKEQLKKSLDDSRISVVPTGVDLQQYRAEPDAAEEKPLVVFTGSMDWEANIDAVDHFCHKIWPQVRARVPDARFRIVGRNPTRRVEKLASDSVEVTGAVSSIIEHLKEARVVVVPLRIGGGTRLKIYEAMAMRKAIVSTSIGAEGLDVHDGRDIVLADSPVEFADAVTRFFCDQELRQRFGRAAAELAAQYDWSAVAEQFAQVLERVAKSAVSAGAPAYATHR